MADMIIQDLYVGDVDDWKRANTEGHDYDRIVTLMRGEPLDVTTHHCPLFDGDGNHPVDFERAVDAVREGLQAGERVLVHCAAGRSRAPTVASTAIAAERGMEWEGAKDMVEEKRGFLHVSPYLREEAWKYLGEYPLQGDLNEY